MFKKATGKTRILYNQVRFNPLDHVGSCLNLKLLKLLTSISGRLQRTKSGAMLHEAFERRS